MRRRIFLQEALLLTTQNGRGYHEPVHRREREQEREKGGDWNVGWQEPRTRLLVSGYPSSGSNSTAALRTGYGYKLAAPEPLWIIKLASV